MRYRAAALGSVLLVAHPAAARLTRLDMASQEPFADSASFGSAGPYVRTKAVAHGEIDPKDPANAGIALLDQAPRNARGAVEYDMNVFILRPADPAKSRSDLREARGNGALLRDVTNRGNKLLLSWLNDAPEPPSGAVNDPRSLADAGKAFTFRRGDAMVWSGWQQEASQAHNGMAIRVPLATQGGLPIVRRIRFEFIAGTRGPAAVPRVALPYPVATVEGARLTVRSRSADPPTPLRPDE